MKKISSISDAEWQVMKIIWREAPCTASAVIEQLSDQVDWQPKTVKTLLSRLLKKNIIDFVVDPVDKKTYHYRPLVSENDCIKEETKTFLDRVYNGTLSTMLINFIEEHPFSSNEIDDLRELLDKKKEELNTSKKKED